MRRSPEIRYYSQLLIIKDVCYICSVLFLCLHKLMWPLNEQPKRMTTEPASKKKSRFHLTNYVCIIMQPLMSIEIVINSIDPSFQWNPM